jgi:hypothetical protein
MTLGLLDARKSHKLVTDGKTSGGSRSHTLPVPLPAADRAWAPGILEDPAHGRDVLPF